MAEFGEGNTIVGNTVSNSGYGIVFYDQRNGVISSNSVADNNTVSGKVVIGGKTNGIDVSANFCSIKGNRIVSSGNAGICIVNASNCIVTDNHIQKPGGSEYGPIDGGIRGSNFANVPGATWNTQIWSTGAGLQPAYWWSFIEGGLGFLKED